ncbi:MAG TPA: DUF962 domain-containing protein [Rhodopila sp.]|uniref:DUF962 domain-containing protein n=1 Tax=Rhodopila sp. TaxID=2480087 RepID=UPI002CD41142|nr:DUF962 domain-containing protein [Rhodopila sp.]HVY17164.1 DUF962 domain-containing protein [Rhodopila sp.]
MTYGEFWRYYLRAHSRPGTRALHYAGSLCALCLLAMAVAWDWRFLPAAVVVGYGFAWVGHVAIERNRPATFGHPLWSLFSDFRMLALWAAGGLGAHLHRAGSGAEPAP